VETPTPSVGRVLSLAEGVKGSLRSAPPPLTPSADIDLGDRRRRAERERTSRAFIGRNPRGAAPAPGDSLRSEQIRLVALIRKRRLEIDGEPRRETVARLSVLVDADHFDEPILHQIVERFEILLVGFAHAAIVAGAGHQIMIAWPPASARSPTPRKLRSGTPKPCKMTLQRSR
jgi:hypothetical protein